MSARTPLGRVRGLGSAKEGAAHWWAQRMTALALIPLSLWFAYAVIVLTGSPYHDVIGWFHRPRNPILLSLFVAVALHHAQLGLQVVIEDYVHGEGRKVAGIVIIKFLAVLLAAGTVFGILKIAFGS